MIRNFLVTLLVLFAAPSFAPRSFADEQAPSPATQEFTAAPNLFAMPATPYRGSRSARPVKTWFPTREMIRLANAAFARAVLRELQKSMPKERFLGRVTVKLLLKDDGGLQAATIVNPTPDQKVNTDVLYEVMHAHYPKPPVTANLLDRTFRVTYVYDK